MKHRILYTLALLFATTQTFAQAYTYDSNNRLKKVVYSNGTTVTYTFDALGNRISKKVTGSTAATYTISASVTPTGSGTVNGIGKYNSGSSIELNAIANGGYKFLKWSDGVTANPRTITVTGDQSFTAQFEESQSSLVGDIVVDGTVNVQDLNSLVNAYLANTQVTRTTDIDNDSQLSIADITSLISMVNTSPCAFISNGHQYVDLGLPSGTLWATCNIGASAPEELGDHFAWGEIETKKEYSWTTYKWCDGDNCNLSNQTLIKYCDRGGYGMIDGKISLEPEDDVAHVNWGGDWHIPTKAEFQELMDNCTAAWIKLSDGLHAYKFTGANGNSIIMPAAGEMNKTTFDEDEFYYWSSELHMSSTPANNHGNSADALEYESKTATGLIGTARYKGYAVRPVLSAYTPIVHKAEAPTVYNGHELVDLGLPSCTLWATCNIGASSPEDYGCYYAWGETTGSCDGKSEFGIYHYPVDKTELVEVGGTLERSDDVANLKWGGEWRMPLLKNLKELIETKYTTCEWTTMNGVNGYRITSIVKGFEGRSIFLPAAGYYDDNKIRYLGEEGSYWSSTLYGDHDVGNNVGYMYFRSDNINWWEECPYYGLPIRPVVSLDDINK